MLTSEWGQERDPDSLELTARLRDKRKSPCESNDRNQQGHGSVPEVPKPYSRNISINDWATVPGFESVRKATNNAISNPQPNGNAA